jgi:hypothetical protein
MTVVHPPVAEIILELLCLWLDFRDRTKFLCLPYVINVTLCMLVTDLSTAFLFTNQASSSDITVLAVPKLSSNVLGPVTYASSFSRPCSVDLPQLTKTTSAGLRRVSFLQGSGSCILSVPATSLFILSLLTMGSSSYSIYSSLFYLVLHLPLSLVGP